MRIKILIISSLLLLAFFAIGALSAEWGGDSTADELLSGGDEGTYSSPSLDLGQAASASRASRVTNLQTVSSPKKATGTEQVKAVTNKQNVTNTTVPKEAEPKSVSGTWYLEFAGDTIQNATLTLFQSSDAVFGKGIINEGNNTLTAAASGSVAGDRLNMDIVPLEKAGLYRLSMIASDNSSAGDYIAFSTIAPLSRGTSRGVRFVSS